MTETVKTYYWDLAGHGVVSEKDGTKPPWNYIELHASKLDFAYTECYKDGFGNAAEFLYMADAPLDKVTLARNYFLERHKGMTLYMSFIPSDELKKYIENLFIGDRNEE